MSVETLAKTHDKRKTPYPFRALASNREAWIETVGRHLIRYGLVTVLVWIGAMKFTAYEAEAISGFVANSPLLAWSYQVFNVRQFSALLGVAELLIAALIAVRPFSPRLSALGSVLAVGMFLTTLTFLFSTPETFVPSLGFPALSALPGQFLIKDVVLLGAALWTAGEALRAVNEVHRASNNVTDTEPERVQVCSINEICACST